MLLRKVTILHTIAKDHVFPEAGMDSDDVKAFDSENDALFEAFYKNIV